MIRIIPMAEERYSYGYSETSDARFRADTIVASKDVWILLFVQIGFCHVII